MFRFTKGTRCPAWVRRTNRTGNNSVDHSITQENVTTEGVTRFFYLDDLFGTEGGAERQWRWEWQRPGRSGEKYRDCWAWEVYIPFKKRTAIYDACIRSVLLYASETLPLIQSLESTIRSCDRRMIRHMAGVTLRNRIPSDELLHKCGLT